MNPVREVSAKVRGWISKWLASKTRDGEPELPTKLVIEFIGGPLDGHRESVSWKSFDCMPDSIEIPISRAQFALLEGVEPKSLTPPTSTAIYDLVPIAQQWRFRFRQQMPVRWERDRDQT